MVKLNKEDAKLFGDVEPRGYMYEGETAKVFGYRLHFHEKINKEEREELLANGYKVGDVFDQFTDEVFAWVYGSSLRDAFKDFKADTPYFARVALAIEGGNGHELANLTGVELDNFIASLGINSITELELYKNQLGVL